MGIDAKSVAELRKMTGLPMMKCKKALMEADGDLDKAADNLRKAGVKASEKVAHRELQDGLVFVHQDGNAACALSLMCQTDFVAKSDDVKAFGKKLAEDLFANAPAEQGTGDDLAEYAMADGTKLSDQYNEFALKMGENIKVGEYAVFKPANGLTTVYIHHNNRIAAMVEFEGDSLANHDSVMELGNDLGMQLSFHKDVKALDESGLDPAWVAHEKEIFVAQAENMPENKREMIAEGKLKKRFKEVVLLDMPFIKNDKVSVKQQVENVGKDAGVSISIKRFARIGAGA
ncbi:MAG: translation elongation factor Ts [Planctomycetota bacterium]|jgi:elongation factor Ts